MMSFRQKKNQNLKYNINISSLIAQDNRTNPLYVYGLLIGPQQTENREVKRRARFIG